MTKQLDLENVKIYTKEDVINAIPLIGQEVYMSDHESFKYCSKCTLIGVKSISNDDYPFVCKENDTRVAYKYFMLCKDANFKEKKYRPYKDISEFCDETGCEEVGNDFLTIRNKQSKQEHVLLYVGYSYDAVHLGGYVLTFDTLLNHYEFFDDFNEDKWLPFGIRELDNE